MRNCFVCLYFVLFTSSHTLAQSAPVIPGGSIVKKSSKSETSFGDKLTWMPQASLNLGENQININLTGQVGYQFSKSLLAGVGGNYVFTKDDNAPPGVGGNYYGGSVFAQYALSQLVHIRGEAESMRVDYFDAETNGARREWQVATMLGAGLSPRLLGIQFQLSLNYNLTHDPGRSWRRSPWIFRFGFSF